MLLRGCPDELCSYQMRVALPTHGHLIPELILLMGIHFATLCHGIFHANCYNLTSSFWNLQAERKMMKMLPFFQNGPIGMCNGSEGCIGANKQLENPSTSVAKQIPACPEPSGDEIWSRDQEKMSEKPEGAYRASHASSIASNGSCTSAGDSPEKGKKGIKEIFTNAFKKIKKIKTPSGKCSSIFLTPPHRL